VTESQSPTEFPKEVTDAIKEAFVTEESDDDDYVEIDPDDFKLSENAGLGTISYSGTDLPTGNTVRVRHLYFNSRKFWTTLKTLADAVLKVPVNPLGLLWHVITVIRTLSENATVVFTDLEAPTIYVLASEYGFGVRVREDHLFARVSAFMKERKAALPDQARFARSNTNLAKLGVVVIEAGSIELAEKILVRRV